MENGDAAKRSTGPLSKIGIEFWVERLYEGTHERDFEGRSGDWAFSNDVHSWRVRQQVVDN